MSPMQRSLAYLREQGYTCDIVEHWSAFTKRRRDLYNLFDILCLHPDWPGCLGVQTTTATNQAARRQKMQESGVLSLWVGAGNRAHIHGWRKGGARGARKTWLVNIWEVTP